MDPREANESVATKFTTIMNATLSPFGVLCDLTLASTASALVLVVGLWTIRHSTNPMALYAAFAAALVPAFVSAMAGVALKRSRDAVVGWLTTIPFPVGNLNALLAGLGDTLEVVFERGAAVPARSMLQPKLDEVSDDVLIVKERPEEHTLEIRLGIIDSKRLPMRTNHKRYVRLCEVMDKVLVPLSRTVPIERVQIL